MRLLTSLLLLTPLVRAAAGSWGFDGASVSVVTKKSDVGANKITFSESAPVDKPLALDAAETIKIQLTTTENSKAKRPHQAFVVLRNQDTGLEAPYPMKVSSSGAATTEIAQKDIPTPLLVSSKPLQALIVIGSFGTTKPTTIPIFDIALSLDPNAPIAYEAPLRYGKREEIHHIFRAAPQSPPKIVSLVFAGAVIAALPVLLGSWLALGANANHLTKALSSAPLSHAAFFGSVVALEGAFFMYYVKWNLFQTLPVVGVLGVVAVLSGMRALGEVQSRRYAGER